MSAFRLPMLWLGPEGLELLQNFAHVRYWPITAVGQCRLATLSGRSPKDRQPRHRLVNAVSPSRILSRIQRCAGS